VISPEKIAKNNNNFQNNNFQKC